MGGTNPAAKAAAFSVHYVEQRAGLCITGSCWILGGGRGKKRNKKNAQEKHNHTTEVMGKLELGGRIPREDELMGSNDEFIQKSVIVTPNWSFIVSEK